MENFLEDLSYLSHNHMDPPEIVATDQNVETQVAGEGVRGECPGVVGEGGNIVGSIAEGSAGTCVWWV